MNENMQKAGYTRMCSVLLLFVLLSAVVCKGFGEASSSSRFLPEITKYRPAGVIQGLKSNNLFKVFYPAGEVTASRISDATVASVLRPVVSCVSLKNYFFSLVSINAP